MFFHFKKFSVATILVWFALLNIGGVLFLARPAKAQVTAIASYPFLEGYLTAKDVKLSVGQALSNAALSAVLQAMTHFLSQFAYQSAIALSTGNLGQAPFWGVENFGNFIQNTGNEAVGVAIEELGKPFGLNLCRPPDIKIDLALRIGIQQKYQPPRTPDCTLTSFISDWSSPDVWKSRWANSGIPGSGSKSFSQALHDSIRADQSDFGIFLDASVKVDRLKAESEEGATKEREEGEGVSPVKDIISGNIETPAAVMKENLIKTSKNPSTQKEETEFQVGAAFQSGSWRLISQTVPSVFLNTLLSNSLQNFIQKGMLPFGLDGLFQDSDGGSSGSAANSYEGIARGGRRQAETVFRDILQTKVTTVENYDIISNLANCPTAPASDNCIIDQPLLIALQQAKTGAPVTIAEAIEKGWMHGEGLLVPPSDRAANTDRDCAGKGNYCYGNLKVLRKYRILPLGFEIAASKSNPDKPYSLNDAIKNFNNCGGTDASGNSLSSHPLCHLVDPNWVVKMPLARCGAFGYGSDLLADGLNVRQEECTDLQNCVGFNKDGSCYAWGYCTREQNVWRFNADTCDAQYATCQAFTNSTGQRVAYLYRTLDTGGCDRNTAGCLAYSLNQDSAGNWLQAVIPSASDNFNSNAVHFNANISASACSSGSAGCSAFKYDDQTVLYLKKAPDYLKCYDTDLTTAAVDWPQTISDLNRLTPRAECKNYAQACVPAEVGCNKFEPITYPGDWIPGNFTPATTTVENGVTKLVWNDTCDQKCVGYAAYREMPSNYSKGVDVSYIVPASGRTCSAAEAGCSGFTNLNEIQNGGEKVEYLAYLRPCIAPDPAKQKNFYTYEGSAAQGYQLKSYTLEKDENDAPKYWYRTAADLEKFNRVCNQNVYKTGAAHPDWNSELSPDCREFNDDKGKVYYRLLAQTIPASDKCASYRLNKTELASDGQCFQNGELRDGFCYYTGLPAGTVNTAGGSRGCSAETETCREYKGNTGNNVDNKILEDFENIAQVNKWKNNGGSISQSLESTQPRGHSLGFVAGTSIQKQVYREESLPLNQVYSVTFWAKGRGATAGRGQNVEVSLENGANRAVLGTVGVGDTWQFYKLTPAEITGTEPITKLVFGLAESGYLFLDNVRVDMVRDRMYLVKNSLSVSPLCDSNLNDDLPGEALGCAEYKADTAAGRQSFFLTNFSFLCREDAIGCTALTDTYNTVNDAGARAYNVWLAGTGGNRVNVSVNGNGVACQIPVGEAGCYVKITGINPADILNLTIKENDADTAVKPRFTASTVIVPSDTPANSPVYLVANKDAACNQIDKGCVWAGAQKFTASGPTYENILIKNDPEAYDNSQTPTLCQAEAVGCSAYTSGAGEYYFKDPLVIGQKICAYNSEVEVNGVKTSGWFWSGKGKCENSGVICSSDSDCSASAKCADIGKQPCYPNYQTVNGDYGLWSFGDRGRYQNFVGACPTEQSGCSQFVDHNDSDKSYYLLDNKKFQDAQADCNGQISERAGCILLDNIFSPQKLWNTAASYADSAKNNYRLVTPVSVGANDANTVVRVTRDRECGEWLYCNASRPARDEKGNVLSKCYSVGVCDSAKTGSNPPAQCASDITDRFSGKGGLLTDDVYKERDLSWKGLDYSGYSILNQYSLADLSVEELVGGQFYLVRAVDDSFCAITANLYKYCGGGGRCYNSKCVYPPTGPIAGTENKMDFEAAALESSSCRAYPEESSPYPATVSNLSAFSNANVCTGGDCECAYVKADYGTSGEKTLYFGLDARKNIRDSVCSGGTADNKWCVDAVRAGETDTVTKDACTAAGGYCAAIKKKVTFNGWSGYCAEREPFKNINGKTGEKHCLTWWPTDLALGVSDVFSINTSAGYLANAGEDRYVCAYNRPGLEQEGSESSYMIQNYDEGGSAESDYNDFDGVGGLNFSSTLKNVYPQVSVVSHGFNISYLSKNSLLAGIYKKGEYYDVFKISSAGSTDHQENFFPLGYRQVYFTNLSDADCADNYTCLSSSGQMINLKNVSRIDAYWDYSNNFTRLSANYISFVRPYASADWFDQDKLRAMSYSYRPEGDTKTVFKAGDANSGRYKFWEWSANDTGEGNITGAEQDDLFRGGQESVCGDIPGGFTSVWPMVEQKTSVLYADTSRFCKQSTTKNALGLRLVFNDNNYLMGAWAAISDSENTNARIGFFFVIYFNNGSCALAVKISDADEGSKPVTWKLRNDALNFSGSAYQVMPRVSTMFAPEYGLMNKFSENTAIFIDPFGVSIKAESSMRYVNNKTEFFQVNPDARTKAPTDSDAYAGGFPLSRYRTRNFNVNFDSNYLLNCDTQFNLTSITPTVENSLCSMLYAGSLNHISMFKKVYGFEKLENYNDKYTNLNKTIDAASPQYAEKFKDVHPPVIAAPDVRFCQNKDNQTGCRIGKMNAFAVNGTYDQNVFLRGSAAAAVRFYAWAHPAQMPLRRVMVDFDNGARPFTSANESISNYKPFCDTGYHCAASADLGFVPTSDKYNICDDFVPKDPITGEALTELVLGIGNKNKDSNVSSAGNYTGWVAAGDKGGFGDTTLTGCEPNFYEVYTNYSCKMPVSATTRLFDADGNPMWTNIESENLTINKGGHYARVATTQTTGYDVVISARELEREGLSAGDIVCAYKPKVQVLDNWGWCTGSCDYGASIPAGCYADEDDCESTFPKSWKYFDKNIIVVPNFR